MKTTYTPGPWRFDERFDGVFIIKDNKLKHVADFGKCDLPETFSNMRIIAAAPELLAALENAANVLAGIATGDLKTLRKDSPALAQARAAIAKAKDGA